MGSHSFPESEDILSEIFKRLPKISLRLCMCVQKSWYYLIQTPDFITLHLNYKKRSPPQDNNYLLFTPSSKEMQFSLRYDNKQCEEYYKLQFPDLDITLFSYNSWTSYWISNGLICLSSVKCDSNIYIWNPVIRKIKTLPASPLHLNDGSYSCFARLAFGYLPKTNDYNVVKFSILRKNNRSMWRNIIDVYSLRSDSWETIRFKCVDYFSRYNQLSNSVIVNNSAFWVAKKGLRGERVIVRFNLVNKRISEIRSPLSEKVFIQACGELLSLYGTLYLDIVEIWFLQVKEDGNVVWVKKTRINLQGKYEWLPLGFRNNSEIILRKKDEFGFVSYDVENESAEFVDLWPCIDSDCYADIQADTISVFRENLVLLEEK